MLVAVFDFGRGVYTYNGLAQAAREISRVAAVHPGVTLGASPEVQDRIAVQDQLIPGMSAPTFSCLSVDGTPSPHNPCASGDYVQVTVTSVYRPMTMTGWNGAITLSASSSSMIP